ncbi:DUF6192 family protein [Streptomyces sp. NPDC000594]|uniref:DUF6192 family protein n=1 Tax=Streptomyces sp. NPDC000594 TaxID=3154261 RepID=UPI00332D3BFB
MEFTDLMAVCEGFIAGAARLVPKMRGQEFTDRHERVSTVLEKLRATADWIETAVATGQTDLDEVLAQLLRGEQWRGGCPPMFMVRWCARRWSRPGQPERVRPSCAMRPGGRPLPTRQVS